MRAVLVGCGSMSKAWLECAQTIGGIEIVGLVDIDLAQAKKRAEEFELGYATVSSNLDEALTSTKPDVVFDVVVPSARYEVVTKAFAHGCHVLSEKPMAESISQAKSMVEQAKESNRVHAIIQNRRYLPEPRRIRRFLESGTLGNITSVHCDFFLGPHFGGFRDQMDHVLLLDMAIHTFDSGRHFSGVDAQAVYCHEWNPSNSWYKHGASAVAIFEMEDEIVFTYRGSWCAEGLRTSWESAWRIICARGTLIWDGAEDLRAERVVKSDGFFSDMTPLDIPDLDPADRVDGHLGLMRDFVQAVQGGTTPETIGSENIKSLAMVFGAIESANKKERVAIAIDK